MYASLPSSTDQPRISFLGLLSLGLGVLLLAAVGTLVGAFYWSKSELERGSDRQDDQPPAGDVEQGPAVVRDPYAMMKQSVETHPQSQRFLAHIKEGNFDSAYALTSARFRERMSKEALEGLAAKYVNLKTGMLIPYGRTFPERGRDETVRLKYVSPITKVRTQVFVTLVEEGEHWRIDQLDVHEDRLPPGIR